MSQLQLTPEEDALIQCAMAGQGGIVDIAVESLQDTMLYSKEGCHTWNALSRLWVVTDTCTIKRNFFRPLKLQVMDLLQKLKDEKSRLESNASASDGGKKKKGTVTRDEFADLNSAHNKLVKMDEWLDSAAVMNTIWRDIETRIQEISTKLNKCSDFLPLKRGNKISLRTGEVSLRTSQDLWSYEIAATGIECTEQDRADNLQFFQNLCKDRDGVVNEELLTYLQRLMGYCLSLEVTDKAFYIFLGDTNTGKSKFLRRLSSVLKKRVGACSREVFTKKKGTENHQTYMEALDGGIAVAFVSEIEDGKSFNSHVLKELSGDEGAVSYRPIYGKTKFFDPTAKMFLVANSMPQMGGVITGMDTRLRKIRFSYNQVHADAEIRKRNEKMIQNLESQGGINATFAWWMEGAQRYFKGLDEGVRFLETPASVVDDSAEFLEAGDSFSHFLTAMCEVWTEGCGYPRELYQYGRRRFQTDYTGFCKGHDYTGEAKLGRAQLVDTISSKFPGQKTKGDWVGVRPKMAEIEQI